MTIKFVGTGSGITSLKRFHSSFLISSKNYSLLVDAGDGISRALLTQDINYNNIDGIIFSHFHPDHFCGLPSLLVQMKMNKRKNPLTIAAHSHRIDFIKSFIKSALIFEDRLGFSIKYLPFIPEIENTLNSNISVICKSNSHLKKYGELCGEDHSFSFLFKVDDKKIVYTGDVGEMDDLFIFKESDINIFITETTHLKLNQIKEACAIIKPARVILTHISDEDEKDIGLFINLNRSRFFVEAAFDRYSATI